jgi:curved DNA-binding protein CbpA
VREPKDLYELLGVPPGANEREIRSAYRRNAIFKHRRGALRLAGAVDEMTHAYEILTDPVRRNEYDRMRELYLVEPRRQQAEVDAEAVRREGRLRRAYLGLIGQQVSRRSRDAVLENAPLVEALASEHDQRELARTRALRRREIIGRAASVALLLALAAGALVLWGRAQ